jgi:hypothetical protein
MEVPFAEPQMGSRRRSRLIRPASLRATCQFNRSGGSGEPRAEFANSQSSLARLSKKKKGRATSYGARPGTRKNAKRKVSANDRSELSPQGFHRGIAKVQRPAHQIGRRQCHPLVQ